MNRLRLALASVLLGIARALLRVNAALLSALPQAAPVVPETGTEPAKSADELVASIERFGSERAADHPAEAVFLGLYVTRMAAGLAPYLKQLTPSTEPPEPPSRDVVN